MAIWVLSKSRVIKYNLSEFELYGLKITDIPSWNYDGSSTNQATGHYSEIILEPKRIFTCPFRENGLILLSVIHIPRW